MAIRRRDVVVPVGKALGLAGLAAFAGFVAALLRRRPPTSYAGSLRQPAPQWTGKPGQARPE